MKRFTLILTIVMILTGAAAAREPESVDVRLGQSRRVDRGRITLRFVSIVEDSRCPMNARCIRAGNARVRLTVSRGRSSRRVELNSNDGPTSVRIFGYKIEFVDLNPQKGAPPEMSRGPKTLTVSVE